MPAYKDKNNGKWFCKFYYKDWQGKTKQKWKRGFRTKKDALQFEREFLCSRDTGPDMTFAHLYNLYMQDMSARLKESTILIKKQIIETKILPYFNCMKLNEIEACTIRRWQNELLSSQKHYSATYIKSIQNQLSALFNYAEKYYGLTANPCHKAGSIGKSKADHINFWTLEEYLQFREGFSKESDAYYCFETLYWTGMREGELLALTCGDISWSNPQIHVSKTYQRLRGKDYITTPKTPKSIRDIPIPQFLCDELRQYTTSKNLSENDRIFPFSKYYLLRELSKACEKTQVKRIRIHDIRHSHVSLLINEGFDAMIIAERVGHEKVSTTLNTYSHLFPSRQASLVSSLENLEEKRKK